MLEKIISYDFSVTENGVFQPRRITRIVEDGKIISTSYHRLTGAVEPGGAIPDELPDTIKNSIKAIWTMELIQKYRDDKVEREQAAVKHSKEVI